MSMCINVPKKVAKNSLKTYSPFRTKDERKKVDWNIVLGQVVSHVYRKELNVESFEQFTELCQQQFQSSLDSEHQNFWNIVREMYFDKQDALNISPEFLLFSAAKDSDSTINKRLAEMFITLLGDTGLMRAPSNRLNFIEKSIFECFNQQAVKSEDKRKKPKQIKESAYLPYLSKKLIADLRFLSSKPDYLFSNFKSFLKLYAFLYTSQLAHNLYHWSDGMAKSRPNYFILDSEKASKERRFVRDSGCKQLLRNIECIFPYLNMAQFLQKSDKDTIIQPLWKLVETLPENDELTNALNEYANSFAADRKIKQAPETKATTFDALKQLLQLSKAQFKTGNKDKDDINLNYIKAVKIHFCDDFIKLRGSAGATLVLNQDYMILLTNMAIGADREKLRLHELLEEFEARGVYLDNQSQEELVKFYERIGNVERMSDSGDAVYVTKTI
ncbi:DNA phosphorothioation-dependent restriction protein DptG [Moritella sp. 36]|uniref:DNA phosphorothioation-dependent restriction protein DptG n=1 Tax=Moritella sp. 36 TaxID=2746233 RepID=UPI001BA80FE0|nr:DNA phosphorothioation-dependent restriction protein DptG [Moritella sp. 36]QUM89945.1 DNA phosphorothioation-dependent restriction protein DptG [Moritella sp. 36]